MLASILNWAPELMEGLVVGPGVSAGTAVEIIRPVPGAGAVMWEHGVGTCAFGVERKYAGSGAWAQGAQVWLLWLGEHVRRPGVLVGQE